MIRFSAIVSVVVVALGLLIAGAVSGTLMLVYLAISVACLALLLLIVGVVVWRDDIFGRPADHDAPVVGEYGGEQYLAPARLPVPAGVAMAASGAAPPADVPVPGRRGRQVQAEDTYEHPGRRPPGYRDRPEAPGRPEAQPSAAREDLNPARSRSDESRREELRRDEFRRDERRREQPRPDERGGRPDPAREHPAAQPVAASAGFATTAGPATAEPATPDAARRRHGDETGRPIANQPAAPAQQDPLARPDPFAGRPEPRTGRSEATLSRVEPGSRRPEPGPGHPESRPGRQGPPAGQAEQPFASPAATRPAPASGQAGPPAAAASDALRGTGPERQPEPPQAPAQRTSQPTGRPADPVADRDPATRQSTQLTPVVRSAKPASPAGGRPDEAPGGTPAGPVLPPGPARAGSPDPTGTPPQAGAPDRTGASDLAGSPDRTSAPPQAGASDRAGTPPPPVIPRPASATADTSAAPGANGASASASAPAGPGQTANGAPGLEVTVVPGIARYHKADCILIRFLGEEDLEKMPIGKAEESGCVACRACRPDKELATA